MLPGVNVEQKILALETLLEKVRTNAAKPRPARGSAVATPQLTTAATRATDDVAGPAIAAAPLRAAPPLAVGSTKFADDDWSDTTETFDTPVPLAAPLPGPAKDAAQKAPATATPKATPGKPTTPVATPKPAEAAPAKPVVAAPTPAQVKPLAAPAAVKPLVATPAVKPLVATPAVKPATPPNTPIPLTKQVAAPVIKTPAPAVAAIKPADPGLNKTLTGVGDGAVKAPDIRAGAIAAGISLPTTGEPPAVEPVVEPEKKPLAAKAEPDRKPSLPSAIADSDGEEDAEPTQLYEPSAASRRAAELAALAENQLEEAKKALGIDKKGESDRVEIRLPDTKPEKIEVKVDAPKLDLPWVEKTERKIEPEKIGLPTPEDKLPKKAGPSQTELDLELVASQKGEDIEKVELDVSEPKADAKPLAPPVPEDKPAATPDLAPISEKKPIADTKTEPEKKPVVDTKPAVIKKPVVDLPVLEKPTPPSRGVSKPLIAVAVILLLAAGAFVGMKLGWFGGAAPTPTSTVAPPTNPTPALTQTATPTTTATAQPPPTTDTAAPAVSASAAPADSAAAPADSAAAAPADSAAAAPADSAATPAPSASAAAAPPATAGTPSIDPATLNNNQGLIFVTSNKPARVYLTGKLAGDTNTELKADCGLKFVRLADPAQDVAKPPMWLTAGEPKQIDCRKYTTFSINVP